MFSLSLVVLTIGFWLKVAVVRNNNNDINITFNHTTSETLSLYCQMFHPTSSWSSLKKQNQNIATFLIPKQNRNCLMKRCVKMHIIGSLNNTETEIPPYLVSSCSAKYISEENLEKFLQESENWMENFTFRENLLTLFVDNGSGKIACSGSQQYFDMYDNSVSFQVGSEESLVAVIAERESKNGRVTLRVNLRKNEVPVPHLRQVKCKMCFKRESSAIKSSTSLASKTLFHFCVIVLLLKEII